MANGNILNDDNYLKSKFNETNKPVEKYFEIFL